jgi:Asp/Glu/hydantoin racemase
LGTGAQSSKRFAGVETTGLTATGLHDAPADEVRTRMKDAVKRLVKRGNVGAVCLGCAGMAGMDEMVREACVEELGQVEGGRVRIVDGVVAGVAWLQGAVRTKF